MGCPYITSVSHSPWSGFSPSLTAVNSLERLDAIIADLGHPLLISFSVFLSLFLMTGWSNNQMTSHMTSFFSTQFDAPSIGMLIDAYMSSYMIQCLYSHSPSALASSPTLGDKLCHILGLST